MYLTPDDLLESVRQHVSPRPWTIQQMPGGASLRRFHRLRADGDPQSLIVMELGPEAQKPEEITAGAAPKELPFLNVQRYLANGRVGVPTLHAVDAERGLLFVEDLGDATLEECVRDADDATRGRYYRAAIDELVALQAFTAAHPDPSCVAFDRAFDQKLLRWELEHFREYGLEARGIELAPADRALLDSEFDRLANELAALTRGFVHRDYQSRNLMVQTVDNAIRIRIVDFQDALIGPYIYDLVGLLRDSYIALAPALRDELVGYYAQQAKRDVALTREHFALQTVQRKLKDAGRFVFIDRVKKNASFLGYIAPSIGYVRDALARLPQYAKLTALLDRVVPELAIR